MIGPEQAPIQRGQNTEFSPNPVVPEIGIESGVERRERAAEAAASIADSSSGLPTVLPSLIDDAAIVVDNTTLQNNDTTPLTANDDDLIEKEWVDRAKKIVTDTKEDPYRREEAVSKLQKEYQEKRYGRELGEA